MSDDNGKHPIPFPSPAGVPLVGMPCVLKSFSIPVNATLDCNCGGADTVITILAGYGVGACPSCGRVFAVAFNPSTMKIEVKIGAPGKAAS